MNIGVIRRPLLALVAGAAIVSGLAVGATAQPQSVAAQRHFSFEGTDVTYDPSVLYGVLPNGMRYAIMKNALPEKAVAMRFHIAAGSAMEDADQAGLAHFLEHMAFNGSTHVEEDQVMKMMERLGSAPGPDTNAGTGQRQTVYMFNLPRNDEESIDTALMLYRETASEL
jgi:zinc protease